jgi:TIR domain-containing protein
VTARRKRSSRRKRTDVFISHASCDGWVAGQIARRLKEFNIESFLSEADIGLGDRDFEERLREALEQCAELVVLLTPEALDRQYVWTEIGAVWGARKPVSAILYRMTPKELRKTGVPVLLLRSNLVEINRDGDHFIAQLGRRLGRR